MSYRIGSFNCCQFGLGTSKDEAVFSNIILGEHLDVIALQEITSRGAVERIAKGLPSYWRHCHDSYGENQSPNEYAYIWNSRRLRECSRDAAPEVIQRWQADQLIRKPYYGRFTPSGDELHGPFVEFRLIDVHLFFGSSGHDDRLRRNQEYAVLTSEIFTRINKRRYGNNMPSYTVMLGDYNLTYSWCARQNIENQHIDVAQCELTTLKTSEPDFCNDFDHFSYDTMHICDANGIHAEVSRINSVENYCGGDFEAHRKTVSDHVPILIELSFL